MEYPNCYGMDLGWEMTQISFYQWKTKDAQSVCLSGEQQEFLMPALLCRRAADGEWLTGEEAIRCASRGAGTLVSGLQKKLQEKASIEIDEIWYSADLLMEQYLKRMLAIIRQWSGSSEIARIAVTLPDGMEDEQETFTQIFARLGVEQDRLIYLSHTECFMYYVVNTSAELWSNEVVLFDYSENGLLYERLSFSHKKDPMPIVSERVDFGDEARQISEQETAERKAYWFYQLAMQQLHKQPVSAVYVTGTGFSGGWADEALRKLCVGRRVFLGQNLYTKGACQAARMDCDNTKEHYIFLNGNMVQESISVRLYQDSREDYVKLVRAGTDYRKVRERIVMILDATNEIEFLVDHALKKGPVHEVMILEHLMERENKTIRLELQLFFADRDTPVVQVRDLGFGPYPSTGRIWEQLL